MNQIPDPWRAKFHKGSKYQYPFMECKDHPGRQRCYGVCKHVVEGTAQDIQVRLANDWDLGAIVCGLLPPDCVHTECVPTCEQCAIERGLLIHA